MLAFVFLALLGVSGAGGRRPGTTCRASAFGARPSPTQYSTDALQAAIDACSASCGTVLLDEPGAYLTAALHLADCVHLKVPSGATLLAGDRREDYGPAQPDWYLLQFKNCTNCSLSGGGTIDGRGRRWVLPPEPGGAQQQQHQWTGVQLGGGWRRSGTRQLQSQRLGTAAEAEEAEAQRGGAKALPGGRRRVRNWADPSCLKPEECRPRLVGVVDSRHVSITGVRMIDPIYWCLHVARSEHVAISRVSIRSDWQIANTDGIDVDGSRHVTISDAEVDTADDAICLKTVEAGRPLEHVAVHDCRLRSRSSAVKLGSESAAAMRHLSFARLAIADSHRGLAIQLRDGGSVHNVTFHNISVSTRLYHPSWWGAAEPIYVTAVPRNHSTQVGTVSGVRFADITALSENGIFLAGGPLACAEPASSSAATACEPGAQEQQQGRRSSQPCHWPAYSLNGIQLERVQVQLVKRSKWTGGCQDYRPSSNASLAGIGSSSSSSSSSGGGSSAAWWPAGLDCSSGGTAALWVSGAQHVLLSDVQVRHHEPWREDWRRGAWIDAASTADVQLRRVDISAAPSWLHEGASWQSVGNK